jgi:hypothetical protein
VFFEDHPSVSIGPYFSYGRLMATRACQEEPGTSEQCDNDPDNDDEGLWSMGLAAKF